MMNDKFVLKKFAECNLRDVFFDSLREDYDFDSWFLSHPNREAFVYSDSSGIKAFLCLKENENETIELKGSVLNAEPRMKICTLKLCSDVQGQRLGEGAIGIALWNWQRSQNNQIYLTVFEKQKSLIGLLEKFGFICVGEKINGEKVFIKDKRTLKYNNPYLSFPFINPNFDVAGYIPIEADFHDTLFPYSEVWNSNQEGDNIAAANGISKVFIASPFSYVEYAINCPVLIYRKSKIQPGYKSAVTSFCSIVDQVIIKKSGRAYKSFEDFVRFVGNKSVYKKNQLELIYKKDNVIVLEMTYCGYFGKGNNVNWVTLKNDGLWGESHPYNIKLTKEQFIKVLLEGKVNVQNIIID